MLYFVSQLTCEGNTSENCDSASPVWSACFKLLSVALPCLWCCISWFFQILFFWCYRSPEVPPLNKPTCCIINTRNSWLCKYCRSAKFQLPGGTFGLFMLLLNTENLKGTNTPPTHTETIKKSQTRHESHPLGHPSEGLSSKNKKNKKTKKENDWKCICQEFLLPWNEEHYFWESYAHGLNFWSD